MAKIDNTRSRILRETVGMTLMAAGVIGLNVILIATLGLAAGAGLSGCLTLILFGRMLASGTGTETTSETERDSAPAPAGPLLQNLDDPQAFIPR